ncbi:MAG: NAD(P)/FAD-dependent oxidoreductase [Halodesulfurarchaeum sp.]
MGVSSTPYICPAAPVEAALLTEHFLRKRGLREDTRMRFFFPGPGPMKKAGDNVAEMAIAALEGRGISYHGNSALAAVDAGELRFENGETWDYDLLWATPPHRPPDVVADSALADESGWIPVDRRTMEADVEDVYAVGDNAKVMIPSIEKPLPKAGVFARKQAEVAAHNIANRVHGSAEEHRFDGVGQCFLAAQYGLTGKAGMVEAEFFAEPEPRADIKQPRQSRTWHWGKLLYERNWHRKWFPAHGGGSA